MPPGRRAVPVLVALLAVLALTPASLAAAPVPAGSGKPELRKLETDRQKGVWKLPVVLPGAGQLTVSAPTIERQQLTVHVAGPVRVPILPKGPLAKRMSKYGEGKVKVTVTFKPAVGAPTTLEKLLKLLKKVPPIRN